MKGSIVSTCEKTFLLKALRENTRLDGRKFEEYRDLKIEYGTDWGLCFVSLGDTKVLAQVSSEIQQPKATRPNEGLLQINVELSSLDSQYFDLPQQSELIVHLNRILQKCIRESRCIDLEALCIVTDKKVWSLRVDLNVTNNEGNLIGCCSVAALAALKHFRYPQTTITDGVVKVHTIYEKNPTPLTVRHYPVVLTYALFDKGNIIIEDPSLLEEKVADSVLSLFMNSYNEFCGMHLEGSALSSSFVIIKCSRAGSKKAKELVECIKEAAEKSTQKRHSGQPDSFANAIFEDLTLEKSQKRLMVQLSSYNFRRKVEQDESDTSTDESEGEIEEEHQKSIQKIHLEEEKDTAYAVVQLAENSAELIGVVSSEDSGVSGNEMDIEVVEESQIKQVEKFEVSDSSEEDEVMMLDPSELR